MRLVLSMLLAGFSSLKKFSLPFCFCSVLILFSFFVLSILDDFSTGFSAAPSFLGGRGDCPYGRAGASLSLSPHPVFGLP